MSLFNTLNTGISGIFSNKVAMNAVSQNIANVNNSNYSRRQVNISTNATINYGGFELGTGSKIESIERVRDQFLDVQYRKYNSDYGYWKTMNSNLNYIQSLYGEPSEDGFRRAFDEFWGSVHKILSEPTVPENKRELIYKAQELSNKMSSLFSDIESVKNNLNNDVENILKDINSKLSELSNLNRQIKELKTQNIEANDLLDKRDAILDELSEKLNFTVKEKKDGQISIILKNHEILNGEIYKKLSIKEVNGKNYVFVDNGIMNIKNGSLGATIELRDKVINEQLNRLNELAATFYDTLNLIHEEGYDLTGTIRGMNFFNELQSGNLETDKLRRIAGNILLSGEPKNYVDSYIKFNQNTINDIKVNFDIGSGELINIENGFEDNSDYVATINSGETLDNLSVGSKFRGDFNYKYSVQNGGLLTFANKGGSSLDNRLIIDFNRNIFKQMGIPTKDIEALKWTDIPSTSMQGIMTFKGPGNYTETLNLQGVTTLNEIAQRINVDADGDGNNDGGLKLVRAFVRNNELYIVPTDKAYGDMKNIIIDDPNGMLHEMNSNSVDLSVLDTSQNSLKNSFGLYAYKTKMFDLSGYLPTDNVAIKINYKDSTPQYTSTIQKSSLNGVTIGSNSEFQIVQNGEEFEILPGADGNTFSWENIDSIEINVGSSSIKIENFYYDEDSAANKLVNQGWATNTQSAKLTLKSDEDLKWRMNFLDFGSFISIQGKKINIDFHRDTLESLTKKINETNTGVLAFYTPGGRFVLKADKTINYDLKNAEIKGSEKLFELLGLWKHEDSTQPYSENFTLLNPDYDSNTLENKLKYASKFILSDTIDVAKNLKVKDYLLNNPDMLAMDLGKRIDSDNDGDIDTIIPSGEYSSTLWEEGYLLKSTKLFSDGKHDFEDYISDMITEVGLSGEKAKRMEINSDSLRTEYLNQRESVKGVSLDEEMANMIKYQQAFNAAAKVINVVDSMLDRIINGLMR
ncbi:flagellar hook-associated protein 1 FlgK [Marinitoga hydrogenitolerans DSM 16785]|uniref:Flagellar hook-associated protein 1 n=1 Tax=Marinitoga hydrogenitolerans (strain DSM 16785 / JCM 12826 / AT1271) TaxID=1122195 RepID=A0A1M4V3F6_MARH1|nr:flagellar hook-associated protein FlgK [Marinitoga hydrogenitolerans]SHE63432.1 flagellar hook-associated protein 1 FlgK [Marinitoga hydrogenitolerans DSM 16785]